MDEEPGRTEMVHNLCQLTYSCGTVLSWEIVGCLKMRVHDVDVVEGANIVFGDTESFIGKAVLEHSLAFFEDLIMVGLPQALGVGT